MTAFDGFDLVDARVAGAIDEIAAASRPDYLDDIFKVTARTRQRPRWTFFERWLPMDTADRPAPPGAFRAPACADLVLADPRAARRASPRRSSRLAASLPPPFGPARQRHDRVWHGGDIYVRDSLDGASRLLVGGRRPAGRRRCSRSTASCRLRRHRRTASITSWVAKPTAPSRRQIFDDAHDQRLDAAWSARQPAPRRSSTSADRRARASGSSPSTASRARAGLARRPDAEPQRRLGPAGLRSAADPAAKPRARRCGSTTCMTTGTATCRPAADAMAGHGLSARTGSSSGHRDLGRRPARSRSTSITAVPDGPGRVLPDRRSIDRDGIQSAHPAGRPSGPRESTAAGVAVVLAGRQVDPDGAVHAGRHAARQRGQASLAVDAGGRLSRRVATSFRRSRPPTARSTRSWTPDASRLIAWLTGLKQALKIDPADRRQRAAAVGQRTSWPTSASHPDLGPTDAGSGSSRAPASTLV